MLLTDCIVLTFRQVELLYFSACLSRCFSAQQTPCAKKMAAWKHSGGRWGICRMVDKKMPPPLDALRHCKCVCAFKSVKKLVIKIHRIKRDCHKLCNQVLAGRTYTYIFFKSYTPSSICERALNWKCCALHAFSFWGGGVHSPNFALRGSSALKGFGLVYRCI